MSMNTSDLKKFAQAARRQLREQVAARLDQVLAPDSAQSREVPAAVRELHQQIAETSRQAVIDRVAYTWFNRLCALRYMDVNHINRIGVVSPVAGFSQPEILQEAKQGHIDDDLHKFINKNLVFDLLTGKRPSREPEQEAYRLLLVAACNALNSSLPFLFEKIADYTELLMPPDLLSENSVLHALREAMTSEACQDVEVIGWLYQYYISERKDEVFEGLKKNQKIEAEDIPAATQLFTPHWIVRYLVENSLGRLWLLNQPDSRLAERMEYYIKPVEPETDYLELSSPEEIKVCDPACGSGHMLTYAFDLLYAIYEEQGYNPIDIPRLILEKNLFGIEIDERAGDLAAFALAMKAREKDKRFFSRGVQPNICVLEDVSFTEAELKEYLSLAGRDLFSVQLQETLKQFEQAKTFGSLVRPILTDAGFVRQELERKNLGGNVLLYHIHERVLKVLRMSEYLSPRYHVVVANPPYMNASGMNLELKEMLTDNYSDVKTDLFSAFIIRNLELTISMGQLGFMSPFVWMFISSYEKLRNFIIEHKTITSLIQLEYSGFEGATVPICTFTLENTYKQDFKGGYIRLSDFRGAEIQAPKTLEAIHNPGCDWFYRVSARVFSKIPGSPIAYWVDQKFLNIFKSNPSISTMANSVNGMTTGENERFLRHWHEVGQEKVGINVSSSSESVHSKKKWFPYNKGGDFQKWYGNQSYYVNWEDDGRDIINFGRAFPRSRNLYFKESVSWSKISSSKLAVRYFPQGFIFDVAGCSIFTKTTEDIFYILGLLNTPIIRSLLEFISPTLNFESGQIAKLPVIMKKNSVNNQIVQKLISSTRDDWNSYETSWNFSGLPLLRKNIHHNTLKESFRTLRVDWKKRVDEVRDLESQNNRIYIETYKLQDDLVAEVPLDEITLSCNPVYRYGMNHSEGELEARLKADTMKEFISYAVGCMFGRYSLDKPGLILANQGGKLADYLRQVPDPSFLPDKDNAIPILDGDWFSDDITERFKQFLRVTFGEEQYSENLAFIEEAIGRDLRSYFLKDFYGEHLKMYKKRPIYWLFSSPKGSFNVLIYMHRYNKDTVSVILNSYLKEYQRKLEAAKTAQERISISAGSTPRDKTAALKEIERLNKVLDELRAYERDVIYPLAANPIEIDLDDGVKVNYAKFGNALAKIPGL